MSTGWTIALFVAVLAAAGGAGFIYGRRRGRTESPAVGAVEGKGPPPTIDPKVAAASKILSAMAPKPQKV